MILGKLLRITPNQYIFEHGSFRYLSRSSEEMDIAHARIALQESIDAHLMRFGPGDIRLPPIQPDIFEDYERTLVEKLEKVWNEKVNEGLKSFVILMDSMDEEVSEEMITQLIIPHLDDNLGEPFYTSTRIRKAMKKNIERTWKTGKKYSAQKVGRLAPEARLIDTKAQEYLQKDSRFWLRHRWDSHIRVKIAETARRVGIEEGLGRREVGRAMARAFRGVCSENPYYWEVVGSAATIRSRTWSHYTTLDQLEIEESVWMTVGDERVCSVCRPLDGVSFSVKKGISNMEACMEAEDPFEARNISPWIAYDRKKEKFYTNTHDKDGNILRRNYFPREKIKDGAYLQKKGFNGPQAHGGCRCDMT